MTLTLTRDGDAVLVSFIDLPEAITSEADEDGPPGQVSVCCRAMNLAG